MRHYFYILVATILFISSSYSRAQTSTGVPWVIIPPFPAQTIPQQYEWQGFVTSSYDIEGIWYGGGNQGWYLKPKADGTGWEAGVINPEGSQGTSPLKISWTPSGGWVIDQAPLGTFFSSGANEEGEYIQSTPEELMQPWTVLGNDGTTFSSTDFEAWVVDTNRLANWDLQFQEFYAANPEIPNPYNPSPNPAGGVIAAAQELNKGLSFQDGQWVVAQ